MVVNVLVGTSRCDVTGGKAAGSLRPLGALTAQRAIPTSLMSRSRSRRKEALDDFRFLSQRLVTSSPTFHQLSHDVQHIQRPAVLGDGKFTEANEDNEAVKVISNLCFLGSLL